VKRSQLLVAASLAIAALSSLVAIAAWRSSVRSEGELAAIRQLLAERSTARATVDAAPPTSAPARVERPIPRPPPPPLPPGESELDRRLAALRKQVREMRPPLVKSDRDVEAVAAFLLTQEGFRARMAEWSSTGQAERERDQVKWMRDNAREALGQLPLDAAGKQRLVEATPGLAELVR
jgi:hypothetical protein